MIWRSIRQDDRPITAAAFREMDERRLRAAPARPERRMRIRRVGAGGFARVVSRPSGRRAAERWWLRVLESMGP